MIFYKGINSFFFFLQVKKFVFLDVFQEILKLIYLFLSPIATYTKY
jgi:hypothetical protein